ncbi:uncharacterized protein PHACADRAFT_106742 [Phanerochaete carnosa HHB-10118-sp]|uniref:Epoxide hydrolase N-terminal domain-containing protein n=1 Tax=Phanerochaete carnosa (strain HHB-10118-sp) TaxID=650164 RepID=K5UJB2_PHACS|nr:uncharacterized protein PHACADRAFT_106742 [Phanerochaete carnosa HHB-10118-sp]EKM49656.1 hypothetical protein PHACADRAFT_106742 [Phanerochaete carnosa HHB-10118-sp]
MPSPVPFRISVPRDALDAVKQRLETATLPPPAPSSDNPWKYGVPSADIARIVEFWKTSYDWRKAEAALNDDLPQFTLPITVRDHGMFQAHFVHKRANEVEGRKGIPLLFIHGWPGHFCEVRKVLPMLTNPENENDVAFDVVAPSLPGFGYTSAPEKGGFALVQYAEFCHNLMIMLGYDKYVIQGGDWGFLKIVHLYGPKHAKAWHTNSPVAGPPTFKAFPRLYLTHMTTPYTEAEKKGLQRTAWFGQQGQGYIGIQSTMPQTLSYSLADSPVGLLAWIYEKLVTWTDDYPWTEEEVLTWIHIYLFSHTQSTSSAATSVRIYYEVIQSGDMRLDKPGNPQLYNGAVPLGISIFPQEIVVPPSLWHRTLGNVVYSARHESGGHFAAYERPGPLVADIRNTFKLPIVQSAFSK